MDYKELIKRIMEEVKDEKLRDELLALVAEKNRRQSEAKQEEEKLINHKTRHGILSKVGWGIVGIFYIFSIFFIFLAFGPLAAFAAAILFALGIIIDLLKDRRQSEAKQEGEKLINHKTRHGILSKVGWGIVVILYIFAIFFIFLAFGPLAAFAVAILAALARIIYLLKETRKK